MTALAQKKATSKKNKLKKIKKLPIDQKLAKICEGLLATPIIQVEHPGGRSRDSCRLILADGRSVIATRRSNQERAAREHEVLSQLSSDNVAVPQVIAFEGRVLIQESLPGQRLSEALHESDEHEIETLLDTALHNLAAIQQAGAARTLAERLPRIGDDHEWITQFLRRPAIIGHHFKIKPDKPKLDELSELFQIAEPCFVKWDARPGNALVQPDGKVAWFDWEHCGARNRLDDMVWLLADEFVPNLPELEQRLVDRHLARYAYPFDPDKARTYFYAYGAFHMAMRLALILDYKGKESWWQFDYCLKGDKVGVTLATAQRTCLRAARWARQTPLTEALAPWFEQVAARLERL